MAKAKTVKRTTTKSTKEPNGFVKALKGIGEYFVGAWKELRQVRWPNRRTTWALTLAVILFSLFFVVLILLLDWAFQVLFELILA